MMAVRYHGCTCHQRFCTNGTNGRSNAESGKYNKYDKYDSIPPPSMRGGGSKHSSGALAEMEKKPNVPANTSTGAEEEEDEDFKLDEIRPQPWYFHVIASLILIVHGFTFLVPQDPDDDNDGVKTLARWFGYEFEWLRMIAPYLQGLAAVFNIALGIVSWWTPKDSERYNRLIQLRVFAFCTNILHAYVTGPIVYTNDEAPLLAPGRVIGLFRLTYLTPGLMAAGVTEVIFEKEQEHNKKIKEKEKEKEKKEKAEASLTVGGGNKKSK